MRPDGPRNPVTGPGSGPEPPFPVRLSGPVIKGFGRGSKELGIPTANISADMLAEHPDLDIGVYYGVVALDPSRFNYTETSSSSPQGTSGKILPAVLSIGYNPFYKNKERSIEIHIMPPLAAPSPTAASNEQVKFHKLPDFYSTPLNLLILGYIRPEYDYVSLEALVEDIRVDCEVARKSLQRDTYARYLEEGRDGDIDTEDVKAHRQWLTTFNGNRQAPDRTSGL
ncbi:Riboflavin kinase [Aspergillus cristatus]|uniref:Riboflavin kinase n=1 Tax=Aspergillus cristatus TaxID=573508 RepID=A0A1E3B4K0_ASPCR|nr:Riboflavin kinase [Aspergillus cristatus]